MSLLRGGALGANLCCRDRFNHTFQVELQRFSEPRSQFRIPIDLEAVRKSVVTFLGAEEDWSRSMVFGIKEEEDDSDGDDDDDDDNEKCQKWGKSDGAAFRTRNLREKMEVFYH